MTRKEKTIPEEGINVQVVAKEHAGDQTESQGVWSAAPSRQLGWVAARSSLSLPAVTELSET